MDKTDVTHELSEAFFISGYRSDICGIAHMLLLLSLNTSSIVRSLYSSTAVCVVELQQLVVCLRYPGDHGVNCHDCLVAENAMHE